MSKLVFVIPVRHPDSVRDWGLAKIHLASTLRSVAGQSGGDWECRVVASRGTDLPPMPEGCTVRLVDIPLPVLPDKSDRQSYFDAVRKDKGLRVYEGVRDLDPYDHVMVVDFDDYVSRRLAAFVTERADEPGWFLSDGYVFSGGSVCYRTYRLNAICGTSLIVRRDLFGDLELDDGTVNIAAVKRYLGSHIFLRGDLENGAPLSPLPFPGAVYRIGNAQSTSGARSLAAEMTPMRDLRRGAVRYVKSLSRYRIVSNAIRQEFHLN